MRILILGQHYSPEDVSGARFATELAEDLAASGHQVAIVTCFPSYPRGVVFPGYKNRLLQVEWIEKVKVIRVWSFISPAKTFWRRIVNYATFSLSALLGGLAAGRHQVIYSYSPPLPLGLAAWLLSAFWRVPWVMRLEDIFPQAAEAAGVIRNKAALSILESLERFLYQKASRISVLSEGFRRNLVAKGVPARKLMVVPLWADTERIQPQEKENEFRREQGWDNRFLLLYAGNMGLTSSLADVIRAAEILSGEEQVLFAMIGEGVLKKSLAAQVEAKKLANVRFLPFQPREKLATLLAAADIGLVTLNPDSSPFSLPGKTYNLLSSGRPILAVAPQESELAGLISAAQCGACVEPGSPEVLAQTVLALRDNPDLLQQMGRNGRSYLAAHFSRKDCIPRHIQAITQGF